MVNVTKFWARVDKCEPGPGCWMWTGPPGNHGYGQSWVDGTVTTAHRVSYELEIGPVPDGLFVLHRCDVKLCVRPSHLYAGTHQDNMDDVARSGHPRRKLSRFEVLEIRRLLSLGASQRTIAERFGVSQRAVWNISCGRTYRYVT